MSDPDPAGWQRLDWRMLLIGPVDVLKQFAIPALIAFVGLSSGDAGFQAWYLLAAFGMAIVAGAVPWLTTRYRFTETQFQVRKGLLNKQLLTAPLDRVRSVDLESSLLHRLLGLSKVAIGTGVDESRIELRALTVTAAQDLRQRLMRRVTPPTPGVEVPATSGAEPAAPTEYDAAPPPAQLLAVLDSSWVRFAPFSLSRLAVVAGAIGALSQFGDELPIDQEHVGAAWEWVRGFAIGLVVLSVVVGGLVAWVAFSMLGYAVQWYALRLTREHGALHLTAGLLTTRSTTVEEARVRGVELREPWLLRLVRGAELFTWSTGVDAGVTQILPASPLAVDEQVGAAVLGSAGPLTTGLVEHGPAARRRCYFRALRPPLLVTAATALASYLLGWPWWIPVLVAVATTGLGVAAGTTAYRHLGHALTVDHLVSGDGVFDKTRTALERDGIIGWVVRQNWFQRRVGLATLVATTAAGGERVTVRDLPLERAVALADAATPGLLSGFLAPRDPVGGVASTPGL